MSLGDHRPTVLQNQYHAPLWGDPATQGDVNTVDWVLKNISSACVTARERERVREDVCWGSRRPSVDVQGGLCVLSPRGRSQGDVPSLLTIDRRHDKLCRLISAAAVVFSLNRIRRGMLAGWYFSLLLPFNIVILLRLHAVMK